MNILNEVRAEAGRDLDMLAEVTKTNLGCDMVFISISKHDELYSVGLDQNSAQVPANRFRKELDTVCSATVGKNKTIVLEDALNHPAYRSLPYVSDGPIGAYLGVPLRTAANRPFGAVCAISKKARKWHAFESTFLEHLAVVVSSLITKELQKGEMNLLHETIREYDLVLMTLASEIPDLVSVHGHHGELLFSSLGLSRFSEEHVIEEAAKKTD
ncbi:MAG: GAF domain-containing protein [Pseudomonadota bacterium]